MAGRDHARSVRKAQAEEGALLFGAKAASYLLPFVARTAAPKGQPLALRTPHTYDHVSVISAVTPDGRLCSRVQEMAFRGAGIVDFLRQTLRQLLGKLLISRIGPRSTTASR